MVEKYEHNRIKYYCKNCHGHGNGKILCEHHKRRRKDGTTERVMEVNFANMTKVIFTMYTSSPCVSLTLKNNV